MASIATQAQPSLYKRIRRKLRRIKRLTVGYIRNMPAYKAYRKYRHHITGPLRMARAATLLEDHKEQKAQQEQAQAQIAVQFYPLSLSSRPVAPIQVSVLRPEVAGKPVQVEYPGEFVQRYREEVRHQELHGIPTQPTSLRPVKLERVTSRFTPIMPEQLPEQVGITAQDAEFLLDQVFPHVDPDQTEVRLRRIQKAGQA